MKFAKTPKSDEKAANSSPNEHYLRRKEALHTQRKREKAARAAHAQELARVKAAKKEAKINLERARVEAKVEDKLRQALDTEYGRSVKLTKRAEAIREERWRRGLDRRVAKELATAPEHEREGRVQTLLKMRPHRRKPMALLPADTPMSYIPVPLSPEVRFAWSKWCEDWIACVRSELDNHWACVPQDGVNKFIVDMEALKHATQDNIRRTGKAPPPIEKVAKKIIEQFRPKIKKEKKVRTSKKSKITKRPKFTPRVYKPRRKNDERN